MQCIKEISDATMIRGQDIVDTLQVRRGLKWVVHICLKTKHQGDQ